MSRIRGIDRRLASLEARWESLSFKQKARWVDRLACTIRRGALVNPADAAIDGAAVAVQKLAFRLIREFDLGPGSLDEMIKAAQAPDATRETRRRVVDRVLAVTKRAHAAVAVAEAISAIRAMFRALGKPDDWSLH